MTVMANRAEDGFTLVEVLAAVVVLTVAIGSIMLVFSNGMGVVWRTGTRNRALHAAEANMAGKIPVGAASSSDQLSITFNGMNSITVSGKIESVTATERSHSCTIHAFIPQKAGNQP